MFCSGADLKAVAESRRNLDPALLVVDSARPYRSVAVDGPVTVTPLGEATEREIFAMSSRYFGERGGRHYTALFMARLERDGVEEVIARLQPQAWRTEILG